MQTLSDLLSRHAATGRVAWIGVRPERRAPVIAVAAAAIDRDGLEGDRARPGKRAVTLIQAEHLPVISALAPRTATFADLRRNVAIRGLNLLALRGRHVALGTAILRITGPCAPCSRMEETLGHGGYAAVRGHGGMTAEVIRDGYVRIEDALVPQMDG